MTPFKIACERYDTDTDPYTVKTVIEATILDYSETPINTVVALTTAGPSVSKFYARDQRGTKIL
jgi:hypothetical protein